MNLLLQKLLVHFNPHLADVVQQLRGQVSAFKVGYLSKCIDFKFIEQRVASPGAARGRAAIRARARTGSCLSCKTQCSEMNKTAIKHTKVHEEYEK